MQKVRRPCAGSGWPGGLPLQKNARPKQMRYILDRRVGGKGRLASCVQQGVVYGYLRHLDILEIKDPLSHLGWQHRRGVVGALRGEGRGGEDQATDGSQGRVTSGGEGVRQGR